MVLSSHENSLFVEIELRRCFGLVKDYISVEINDVIDYEIQPIMRSNSVPLQPLVCL